MVREISGGGAERTEKEELLTADADEEGGEAKLGLRKR